MNENTTEVKGYVLIETVGNFQRDDEKHLFREFDRPSIEESYAGKGWYKITYSRVEGEFIKIAAQRDAITVEARFNMGKNVPNGSNGSYEIKGGMFAGNGTFLKISRQPREDLDFQARDNADFIHFFVCHSHSLQKGIPYLRWRIALKEFSSNLSICKYLQFVKQSWWKFKCFLPRSSSPK